MVFPSCSRISMLYIDQTVTRKIGEHHSVSTWVKLQTPPSLLGFLGENTLRLLFSSELAR